MGREIKRVALDFDWPLDKRWDGFINPYYEHKEKCLHCKDGYSPEGKRLNDLWYGYIPFKPEDRGSKPFTPENPYVWAFAKRNVENSPEYYGKPSEWIIRMEAWRLCELWNGQWVHHLNVDDVQALLDAGQLRDFTHTWNKENGWVKKDPPYIPTPEEVNNLSLGSLNNDRWFVIQAEARRLGVSTTCSVCDGESSLWPSKEIQQKCEDWEPTEPPAGEGWQVWETVSEGSPITPVLPTREALIEHLVQYGTTFEQYAIKKGYETGSPGWTRPNAEAFVKAEYACSMVGFSGPGGTRLYGPNQLADYENDKMLTDSRFD
jgi:hypothetical protein